TTRPDTLFGATFMVLAPEHPLVAKVTTDARRDEVEAYVAEAKNKSDLARQQSKEKTGVFTGGHAINPVNGAEVPIWVADYVLWGYGTGAIMAVPAHDTRDFEFAKAFGIPIVEVVSKTGEPTEGALKEAMAEPGVAVNSGKYDGMETAAVKAAITADLAAEGKGEARVQFKLRDWVFSRQRYWGEPFPIYFPVELKSEGTDPRQGEEGVDFTVDYDSPIPVEESALPVTLPELEDYAPGDDPRGVLARAKDWRFFQKDGRWFARETNTMPQWAGSCWYYLRFCDPDNDQAAWSEEAVKTWLPVDLYVGGAEHAVLHLLYARFWHQVLFDAGYLPVEEPFQKLVHQGIILGEIEYVDEAGEKHDADAVTKTKDGKMVLEADPSVEVEAKAFKMSKSRGNVVNPDDIVESFGADALRTYEMFMGPLEASKPWNTESIGGVKRFLDRCWRLASEASEAAPDEETLRLVHKTIDKVTGDIEGLRFNTAISAMMVLSSELQKAGAPKAGVEVLAQLVHPFAPHLGEEMWALLGHAPSVQAAPWPVADPELLKDDVLEIPVQVKGKKRGVVELPPGASEADALAAAKAIPKIAEALEGGTLRKTIWVQDKILNLIIT
ncbi:MAG TPA: leucine--tRNA ligase, partial [Polyangiaceae bacterium LLY-WYZ-15_(1-7)]|nr:leucine--tRNA ligase [Polyangiaceae bacterium LLY-WYZ-15_(1-7)]